MNPEIQDLSAQSPHVVVIKGARDETPSTKTLTVKFPSALKNPDPGQFMMVWVPGSDEIPISVAGFSRESRDLSLTIANVGITSNILTNMKIGQRIGLRGPYGRGFDISNMKNKNVLLASGGCGAPPIIFAAERLKEAQVKTTIINGAKSAEDLLYVELFPKLTRNLLIATDDGTEGYHGTTSDLFGITLKSQIPDLVLTCGPEQMMKKIWSTCLEKKVPFQASLERYMKCAIGVCGSCALGEYLICRDGPVLFGDQLAFVQDEWGVFSRDASGVKKQL